GTYREWKNSGFVVGDNKGWRSDILIGKSGCMGGVEGDKVVVKIRRYGEDRLKVGGEGVLGRE
uniref:hypothetical protein n=1 Tax=Bacillus mycoides TaxID=1405 RepID=UPI001642C23C